MTNSYSVQLVVPPRHVQHLRPIVSRLQIAGFRTVPQMLAERGVQVDHDWHVTLASFEGGDPEAVAERLRSDLAGYELPELSYDEPRFLPAVPTSWFANGSVVMHLVETPELMDLQREVIGSLTDPRDPIPVQGPFDPWEEPHTGLVVGRFPEMSAQEQEQAARLALEGHAEALAVPLKTPRLTIATAAGDMAIVRFGSAAVSLDVSERRRSKPAKRRPVPELAPGGADDVSERASQREPDGAPSLLSGSALHDGTVDVRDRDPSESLRGLTLGDGHVGIDSQGLEPPQL